MISKEQLATIAEAERRRLQAGGQKLTYDEMQKQAHEYAGENNAETEIAVYRILEKINDQEKNRRLYDRKYHLFNSIGHNREIHALDTKWHETKKMNAEREEKGISINIKPTNETEPMDCSGQPANQKKP